MVEIERKFILEGFPEDFLSAEEMQTQGLVFLQEVWIEQGYLGIEPEVRLHKAYDLQTGETDFHLTLKGGGTLSRTELVTDVTEAFYEEAKKLLPGKMIEKRYRKYRFGQWYLEVCHVDAGTLHEFYYAEIEFATETEAKAFKPPAFLRMEVTYDETCKMKNYWKRTRR